MTRDFCVALFVLLQLCYRGNSCPAQCQCFTPTRVFCSDERLTDMPKNLSSGVREMVVMTTGITHVRPGAFPEGSELTKLVFLNNLLRSVVFGRLQGLQELEISGNHRLEDLGTRTLSELGNLTELVLNFNRFRFLLGGMFDGLQKLETLQLKGNVLIHLSRDLFRHLSSLHLLDLSLNMISTVDKDLFSSLGQLEILRLDYNLINSLTPGMFGGTPRLRELCLQGNRVTELPQALLSQLANLEKLNLRGNLIKELGADVFPPRLRELNLENNRLVRLSPATFHKLPHLTHLLLSKNQLSVLQEDLFRNLSALRHVDLSENLIIGLPKTVFRGLSELAMIHLQKNNISALDGGLFEDQADMEQLHLSDNALRNVPAGLLDLFLDHNVLQLHGNPWACDCLLLDLYDWLVYGAEVMQDISKMFCAAPRPLRGQGLISLKREQLVCAGNFSAPLGPPAATRPEETTPTSHCVVQETNGTVSVQCATQKCPQLNVVTRYHDERGDRHDFLIKHRLPESTQCLNSTVTLTVD